jgi:hypothetical protein
MIRRRRNKKYIEKNLKLSDFGNKKIYKINEK